MRIALALALVLSGCGMTRVGQSTLEGLPLESKLDLIEAENDLFIAIDAVDEAAIRVNEAREDYQNSELRIDEAEESLRRATEANTAKLIDIGRLSVLEAKQRREFLSSWLDAQKTALELSEAKLQLAEAQFERTKAIIVKKANVEGSQDIDLAKFDRQVSNFQEEVDEAIEAFSEDNREAEKYRSVWYSTRHKLAKNTGGGQGSPWVE